MDLFHYLAAFISADFLEDSFGGFCTALTSGRQNGSRFDEWRTHVVAVLTDLQVEMRMAQSMAHGSVVGGAVVVKHGLELDRTQTSLSVDFRHGQRAIMVNSALVCAHLLVSNPLNPTTNIQFTSCQYPVACLCAKAFDLRTEVGPNPGCHRFDVRGIVLSHGIVSWQRGNRDIKPQ